MTAPATLADVEERGACHGHATIPCHIFSEDAEECVVCGTKVRWDLVDHPFFGFTAGCDAAEAALKEAGEWDA